MTDNMENVQPENQSIRSRFERMISSVILGAAAGMGTGYYTPSLRLDRRTYQGQEIDPIIPPSVPPLIGGGETTSLGISVGETHDSPRPERYESYSNLRPRPRQTNTLVERLEEGYRQRLATREMSNFIGTPRARDVVGHVIDSERNRILPREYDFSLLRDIFTMLGNPTVRGQTAWRPQLPMQSAGDVEYLAAGEQKLTEKPAVSVAGTPVTFWKGPLQKQHGIVECEYFGGVRSMMRVKLQKPLSFEEFSARIPLESRAKDAWENAKKSSYVQDDKLAYFTVPWSELIIDASPEYLESRKVRAEFDIGRQRCSGTVHSLKQSGGAFVTDKYVIELDEPVKGSKQQNYSIVAISKHLVRPIRSDTEKYIETTVKGNPEKGCTLTHEDMEIS